MRDGMLIVHFLGLAMGLGTSFAIFFLGIAKSKMDSSILSTMGHIGLSMLIISGLYLITPFWGALSVMPMLIAKLLLVLVLTIAVILAAVYSKRAKKGDTESNLKKLVFTGRVALLSGILIVILAVLIFH